MGNIAGEIDELKKRIRDLERQQELCKHEWKEEYAPIRREVCVGNYSDPIHYRSTGYYETIDRWCRTCTKCGKKEYAYEEIEEPVVVEVKRKRLYR